MKCVCGTGVNQLYQKRACRSALSKVVHVSFMANKGTSGQNYIDLSTTPISESIFLDLYSAENGLDRLHTVYDIKNTEYENRDFRTVDYNDGSSDRLGGGGLDLQFITKKSDLDFITNVQDLGCANPYVFLHLADNKIVGYADRDKVASDQKLYAIPVENIEITKFNPTNTDDDTAHVEITIHFDETMDLEKWVVVEAGEHEWNNTSNYEPAQVVMLPNSGTSTSNVIVEVYLNTTGIMGNRLPFTGLVLADFKCTVNGVNDTIISASESPDGKYTITTTATLTSNDVVMISLDKSGYIADPVSQIV